jgi:RNA polymerase sigma-70 factor, ECF subfamily
MTNRLQPADEILARRVMDGQIDAFEELLARHRERVYRLCRYMAGNAEDAEDWAQECFVRVYVQLRHYNPTRPFRPWFLRVVSNTCINLMKQRQRQGDREHLHDTQDFPTSVDAQDPLRIALQTATGKAALMAVDALSPLLKEALVLRVVEGLTFQELANVLRVPLQTAVSRVRRALEQVRQEIASQEVEVEQ